jgi:hypothetical protein
LQVGDEMGKVGFKYPYHNSLLKSYAMSPGSRKVNLILALFLRIRGYIESI